MHRGRCRSSRKGECGEKLWVTESAYALDTVNADSGAKIAPEPKSKRIRRQRRPHTDVAGVESISAKLRPPLFQLDKVVTGSYLGKDEGFMKAVGIKTLKARLSEYLRLVKAGETVLITERDQVIAEIKPTLRQEVVSPLEEFLTQAQEDRLISLRSDDVIKLPKLNTINWVKIPMSAGILDELRYE